MEHGFHGLDTDNFKKYRFDSSQNKIRPGGRCGQIQKIRVPLTKKQDEIQIKYQLSELRSKSKKYAWHPRRGRCMES